MACFEIPNWNLKQRSWRTPLGNGWTLDEDILALIVDLPELIVLEKEYRKKQNEMIRFRCSLEEKKEIEKRAVRERFPTVSAYLRALGNNNCP